MLCKVNACLKYLEVTVFIQNTFNMILFLMTKKHYKITEPVSYINFFVLSHKKLVKWIFKRHSIENDELISLSFEAK